MIFVSPDHRRFALWCIAVLIVSLPPWWLWGADAAASLLAPAARLVMPLFGLPGLSVVDGNWLVQTDLALANGDGNLVYPVAKETVRRLLLAVPLFLAFMVAPPRPDRSVRAILRGLAILALIFILSFIAYVWGELAPMLNPTLATVRSQTAVQLAAAPLHPAAAQVALLGRYIAMSVLPLLSAILLWALLNPQGRMALAPTILPE